jgi:hypothetical protein
MMSQHLPSLPVFTGGLIGQPRPEDTLAAWYVDQHAHCTEAGFLDAPEFIPYGGERAADYGMLRLGIAYVDRRFA